MYCNANPETSTLTWLCQSCAPIRIWCLPAENPYRKITTIPHQARILSYHRSTSLYCRTVHKLLLSDRVRVTDPYHNDWATPEKANTNMIPLDMLRLQCKITLWIYCLYSLYMQIVKYARNHHQSCSHITVVQSHGFEGWSNLQNSDPKKPLRSAATVFIGLQISCQQNPFCRSRLAALILQACVWLRLFRSWWRISPARVNFQSQRNRSSLSVPIVFLAPWDLCSLHFDRHIPNTLFLPSLLGSFHFHLFLECLLKGFN